MTQQRHEAPEIGAMAGRMLNALIRRAAEGDTEALEELVKLQTLASAALTAAGAAAHDERGYSWAMLAAATGTTRSAASQRFGATSRYRAAALALAPCGTHLDCVGRKRCRH